MVKIDTQLLQQRRLPIIPFRPKRRQQPRPQPSLSRPHLPARARLTGKRPETIVRRGPGRAVACLLRAPVRVAYWSTAAISLEWCTLAGYRGLGV